MKKNLNMSNIMKEAHARTKEFVEKYGVDYQTQLGLFISYLIEEEMNNKEITFDEWFEDYQSNNLYNYIFYKNNILEKNGKITIDAKKDAKNTSTFYQILPSEAEDIRQLALMKVMERFQRVGGTIQRKHRFSVWSIACLNATKQHSRHLTRFKAYNQDNYADIAWENGQTTVLYEDDKTSLFKLDLENILNDKQLEIISYLEQGYNKVEVAELVGISRTAVYKNIDRIQSIMIENGLAIGY